jgi:hypothetical protein
VYADPRDYPRSDRWDIVIVPARRRTTPPGLGAAAAFCGPQGIAFGADDYIRISYATSLANIEKGLGRMDRFVRSL